MRTQQTFIKWLEVVLVLVLIYSLLLVFAGTTAGSLFSWFGFGPDESIDTDAVQNYLRLPYMVLGAVMAGWAFLMIQILWFVLDTGMSLVLGYPTHALFNIPFAVALGIPLLRLKPITL